ncbi:MAG TPA: aminoglycoside phosphotransferase family protein [Bauldia sp.]|nr:aminoglycoside phosphotransferase family protein [Bauldia sp.]
MSPDDARILDQFHVGPADLIGEGGESRVYALGADEVLRVPRTANFGGASRERLQSFLAHIAGRLPFATPEILEIGPDEAWTIERRLPGRSMLALLRTMHDDHRDRALRNYVTALDGFGTIRLDTFPYGHLLAEPSTKADDWRTFLWETLIAFRTRNRVTIAQEAADPYALFEKAADMLDALPLLPAKVLVHGDYFPGNVLLDDELRVSAVLDFGTYTVCGDPALDLAVAYQTLELIEECTADDARFVRDLIMERHGDELGPAFQFYRAYLAFSMADPANANPPYPKLYGWAMAMLKLLAADRLPG